MKTEKLLVILGGVASLMIAILTIVAIYSYKKLKSESNKKRTQPAREARWTQKDETPAPIQDGNEKENVLQN